MRKASIINQLRNLLLGGTIVITPIPFEAEALPSEGRVKAGSASISHSANKTTINQSSSRAVLEWGSFNVQSNETVQFVQPSASAATLNRILDQNPSQIHGQIQANGQVFLMNGNGIIFGAGSRVNAAGFFATTHSISNENFMSGNYSFSRTGNASISNQGTITAATGGFVGLAADRVSNQGVIVANQGSVSLASGNLVTLDFDGDGLMQFAVSGQVLENTAGYESAVSNSGSIQAEGGQVVLTAHSASNVFNHAVNNSGIIEATTSDDIGGLVELISDGGQVTHSGTIDVSGSQGGGVVHVGGEYQGKGETPTAENTFIAADSFIRSNAVEMGDGGEIIVWADNSTEFLGTIEARAGPNGGDGGFVEVSGKNTLKYRGFTDLSSRYGSNGSLLLDPKNIIIASSGSSYSTSNNEFDESESSDVTITSASIESALGSADVTLQANNDITVNDDISSVYSNDLTLQAGRDINLNSVISISGQLTAVAGETEANGVNNDYTDSGNADISMSTDSSIIASAINLQQNGSGGMTLDNLYASSAGITVNSAGNVTVKDNIHADGVNGDISISVAGNLTVSLDTSVFRTYPLDASGDLSLTSMQEDAIFDVPSGVRGDSIAVSGTANIFLTEDSTFNAISGDIQFANQVDGYYDLTLEATSGEVGFGGAVGNGATLIDLIIDAAAVDVDSTVKVQETIDIDTGTLTVDGGQFETSLEGVLLFGEDYTDRSITITNTGTADINQPILALSNLTLDGSGAINLSNNLMGDTTTISAPINLDGSSTITASDGKLTLNGTIDGAEALTLSSSGEIEVNGNIGGTTALSSIAYSGTVLDINANIAQDSAFDFSELTSVTQAGVLSTTSLNLSDTSDWGATIDGNYGYGTTTGALNIDQSLSESYDFTLSSVSGTIDIDNVVSTTGDLTLSGGGTVNLSNNLTGANVITSIPINLDGSATITASSGTITVGSTIDGAQSLSLVGNTEVELNAAVGGSTGMSSLTFNTPLLDVNSPLTLGSTYDFSNVTSTTLASTITAPSLTVSELNLTFDGASSLQTTTGELSVTEVLSVDQDLTLGSVSGTVDIDEDVTTTGALRINGSGTVSLGGDLAGATLTTSAPISLTGASSLTSSSGKLTIGSTIDGRKNLSLTGATEVEVNAVIGGSTSLNTVTLDTPLLDLNSSLTSTSALSLSNVTAAELAGTLKGTSIDTGSSTITLDGATTLQSSNSTITVGATIDGAQSLSLLAPSSKNITLNAAIGSSTALSGLSLTGLNLYANSDITADGDLNFSDVDALRLDGDITGRSITLGDASLVLTGASQLGTTTGDLQLSSDTNFGSYALVLNTESGVIDIDTEVTANGLTLSGSGSVELAADLSSFGNLTIDLPVVLEGDVELEGGTGRKVIQINSTIDGAYDLNFTGAYQVNIDGAIGSTTPIKTLSSDNSRFNIDSPITVSESIDLSEVTSGDLSSTLTAPSLNVAFDLPSSLTFDGDAGLAASTGKLTINEVINTSNALSLSAVNDEIEINRAIGASSAPSSLTFNTPLLDVNSDITVNDGFDFSNVTAMTLASTITATSLNYSDVGITFDGTAGLVASTGKLTIGRSIDTDNALTLSASADEIEVNAAIGASTSPSSLTLNTPLLDVNAAISADSMDLTSVSSATLASTISANSLGTDDMTITLDGAAGLTASSGKLTIGGAIDGAQALSLSGASEVEVNAAIGSSTAPSAISFDTALLDVNAPISQSGAFSFSNIDSMTLASTISASSLDTTGNAITFDDAAGLTASSGKLTIGSTIDTSLALSLSGSSEIEINSAIGSSAAPSSVSFDTALLDVNAPVTQSGAFSFSNIDSLTLASTLTASSIDTSSSSMTFDGASSLVASSGRLTIGSAIDTSNALSLIASSGEVEVNAAIGGTTASSDLSIDTALLDVNAAMTADSFDFNDVTAMTLASTISANSLNTGGLPITLDGTAGLTASSGKLTIGGVIDGAQALSLSGNTEIEVNANMGSSTAPSSISFNTPLLDANADITQTSDFDFSDIDAVTLAGTLTGTSLSYSDLPITFDGAAGLVASTGKLTIGRALDTSNAITLSAAVDEIEVNAAIGASTAPSSLSLNTPLLDVNAPITSSGSWNLANVSAVNLASTLSGTILNTFTTPITLDGTSALTANSGKLTISGAINGAQALSLTGSTEVEVNAAIGATTAPTSLTVDTELWDVNAAINAGSFDLSDVTSMTLASTISGNSLDTGTSVITLDDTAGLTASAGKLTIGGTIDGAQQLNLSGSTEIEVNGNIGSTTAPSSISFNTALLDVNADITQSSAFDFSDITATTLAATLSATTLDTTGKGITVDGSAGLTASSGKLTIGDAIDSAQGLSLSGTSEIEVNAAIGGTTAPSSLSFDTALLDANSPITVDSAFDFSNIERIALSTTLTGTSMTIDSSIISLHGDSGLVASNGKLSLNKSIRRYVLYRDRNLSLSAPLGEIEINVNLGFDRIVPGYSSLTFDTPLLDINAPVGAVSMNFDEVDRITLASNLGGFSSFTLDDTIPLVFDGDATLEANNLTIDSPIDTSHSLGLHGSDITILKEIGGEVAPSSLEIREILGTTNSIVIKSNITTNGYLGLTPTELEVYPVTISADQIQVSNLEMHGAADSTIYLRSNKEPGLTGFLGTTRDPGARQNLVISSESQTMISSFYDNRGNITVTAPQIRLISNIDLGGKLQLNSPIVFGFIKINKLFGFGRTPQLVINGTNYPLPWSARSFATKSASRASATPAAVNSLPAMPAARSAGQTPTFPTGSAMPGGLPLPADAIPVASSMPSEMPMPAAHSSSAPVPAVPKAADPAPSSSGSSAAPAATSSSSPSDSSAESDSTGNHSGSKSHNDREKGEENESSDA